MVQPAPRFLWAPLLLLLGALIVAGPAVAESRVYQLHSRPGEDVAAQIRELYPDGQVHITARGSQMVVRGEPALLDEVGRLIRLMDVAPAQLRITVRSVSGADGSGQSGSVVIRNRQAGVTVEHRVTSSRRQQERNLIIQDGQSAQITSGQIRAFPLAVRGGRNPAAILGHVETRSGFVVTPQVISGQMVELNIMAFEEDPANAMPGYDTEAVMTIRRVRAGEWVELGSASSTGNTRESGLIYRADGSQNSSQTFEVRVDVL